jgi:hypothetical protein
MDYQAAYRLDETTDRAKIEAPAASPVMNMPKATAFIFPQTHPHPTPLPRKISPPLITEDFQALCPRLIQDQPGHGLPTHVHNTRLQIIRGYPLTPASSILYHLRIDEARGRISLLVLADEGPCYAAPLDQYFDRLPDHPRSPLRGLGGGAGKRTGLDR